MKNLFAAMLVTAASTAAFAFDDTAQVISAVPITAQVNTPTQRCWTETVASEPKPHGYGGAILGGAAGGLLGAQFGKGNGKVASAAVGAVAGALAGDRIENAEASPQPVQRCESVNHVHTRITGYTVTYEYQGRQFTTTMPPTTNYESGAVMPVAVSVSPR
jgi:uncharacterized protein YcfJ